MQNNVLDYLKNIVKIKPDKIAFANETYGMTFGEIYNQSRSIGSWLYKNGIYHQPVVIFMNKQPKEVSAFMGIITGGDFYVPIDEEMPIGRIQLILDNVEAPIIICDKKTVSLAQELRFGGEIVLYDDICCTEVLEDAINEIYSKSIDTDPIYIVFTSGSTGIPKGVVACHRSVIDYIEQLSEILEFDENTVFGNQTPLYFDACLKELYPTFKFGAVTYLIPKKLFMTPKKLVNFLNEFRINTICWVVSALTMISAFDTFKSVKPEYLHTVAFGSEVFPIKQFNKWKSVLPNTKFINLYGPTEGTGMCCYYKVNREFEEGEVIPIGTPFKNTDIILLNEKNERAAEGENGEICIRGTSVTLGYYNNFEKTNEVYVQNPLNRYYPETIYRTGDIGKYNEYGELVFVSRKDYQIKHMGHRIELGEIEVNVNMVDEVKMSGCIYDDVKGKIVVYYVGDINEGDLTMKLRQLLPRYMVPNCVIKLDNIPLTANGKIDRRELKNMYKNTQE
jgi:amino acid adenylation domain-containing protein